MTLGGLIERLQEIRDDIGPDCNVHVRMLQGNRVANAKIEMVAADYKDGKDSVYIEMGFDEPRWFQK